MRLSHLLPALLVGSFGACNAYDGDLGATPFLCGDTDPRCPVGYACMMDPGSGNEICVSEDDTISSDFDCNDDSAREPNGTLAEATMTPVDTMKTYSLDGLAVCPARDRDNYKITIATMNEDVELVVEFGASGAALEAAILNAGGIPIATGSTTTDSPRTVRAFSQNLPAGTYYAVVFGPTNTDLLAVNNYTMTINVTGP